MIFATSTARHSATTHTGRIGEERDLWDQSPFFNFSVVSRMESDDDQTEVKKLVEDSVCTLKQFPTDNIRRAKDSTVYPEWKVSPRHGSLAESAIDIGRCSSVFEWWGDPIRARRAPKI